MADYSSLFGGVQAPNIMNGAMAGLRMPYEIQGADQGLQKQAISNMSDLEKLKMMQESENPRIRAENSLKEAEATAQNNPDLIAQKIAADMAKAQSSEISSQSAIRAEQQKFIYEMGQEIQQRAKTGKVYDPMSESSVQWWKDKQNEAKKLKMPFPEMPDTDTNGNSKVLNSIVAKSNSLAVSPEFIKAMAVAQEQSRSSIEGHKIAAGATTEAATTHAKAVVDAANIAAGARVSSAELNNNRDARTIDAALISDVRAGREPNPFILSMAADRAFDNAMRTGEGIDQIAAKNRSDYRDKWIASWMASKKQQVMQEAGEVPGPGSRAVQAASTKSVGSIEELSKTQGQPGDTRTVGNKTYKWVIKGNQAGWMPQ